MSDLQRVYQLMDEAQRLRRKAELLEDEAFYLLTGAITQLRQEVDRMEAHHAPRMFSVSEAAEYLGVSVRTIQRMIKDGRLPVIKAGRRAIIAENDIYRLKISKTISYEQQND